jgi:hypothetical protein
MSDVITFNCTGCGMPYRVAATYAGREFACKKCGVALTVPQPEPQVEMGSGTEVMRRTTPSGRQVSVDPTRVFKRERETSQRMAAVAPAVTASSSGKGLLIGGVIVGLLLVGGVVAAMVLLTGTEPVENSGGKAVAVDTEEPPETSERDRLMDRLDEGLDAAGLVALFNEADGKLEPLDHGVIGRRMVTGIASEGGGAIEDAELLALADRLTDIELGTEAARLYAVIISRHRGAPEPPEAYRQARAALGEAFVDFDAQLARAGDLVATGVAEGVEELRTELETISRRADEGWVSATDKTRVDRISADLDAAEARVQELRRTDPFAFKAAQARLAFHQEKASTIGTWVSIAREPFVVFVQLQADEDAAAAEQRLDSALAAAGQFHAFFEEHFRTPLGLKRALPSSLPGPERDGAPIVIKLFRDASHWQVHLRGMGYRDADATVARTFTEPGTGHVSLVYDTERESLGAFIRALVDVTMYNHHPAAPTTLEDDVNFQAYSAYILRVGFHAAVSMTSLDRREMQFRFMNDTRAPEALKAWRLPFARSPRGGVRSLGGQALTLRELAGADGNDVLRQAVSERLGTFAGWTEEDLLAARVTRNLDAVVQMHMRGFFDFLFHWGPDGEPKYRAKLLEFVRTDLAGEVDAESPLPAFEKAFGLDDAGWKQLEADFSAYQGG